MRTLGVALLLAGALAACDAAPRPPTPRLWTLFDVQALYARNKSGSDAIATDAGLLGGVALGSMLDADDHGLLHVQASWAEGYTAAYATTEVWANFDEVWVQPMYVPIKGRVIGTPDPIDDASVVGGPIFSVGPHSGFYSPFWRIFYVEVPAGTVDGSLTSVRQILDGKYRLVPSAGMVAALAPDELTLDPMAAFPSGGAVAGKGWLDGAPISFVRFPAAPFTWNDDLVVDEVPIYHFVFPRPDDGRLVVPDVASVLGTGPPYSRTPPPADAQGNISSKYSAYWRLYTVQVPAEARVFDPFGTFTGVLDAAGIPGASYYGTEITDIANIAKVNPFVGRIALDPTCFSTVNNLDPREGGTCVFLDSQRNIEAYVGQGAIRPTAITVTCPLVSLRGAAVAP